MMQPYTIETCPVGGFVYSGAFTYPHDIVQAYRLAPEPVRSWPDMPDETVPFEKLTFQRRWVSIVPVSDEEFIQAWWTWQRIA